jgi:DNA polymerase-3 subunit delta
MMGPMTGGPENLRVLCGEETFLIDEAARAIWNDEGAALVSDLNRERLEGPAASPEAVAGALRQAPFLDARRLVMVVDPPALGRVRRAPARAATKRKKGPDNPAELLTSAFLECARSEHVRCVLVLHQALAPGSPFDGQPGVRVTRFASLRRRDLDAWLAERLQMAGLRTRLNPAQVARQVLAACGPDLARLSSEVEKLAAYSQAAELDLAALEALSPAEDQSTVFQLADAVLSRDAALRHRLLLDVTRREDPQRVLALLARQVRLWLRVREARDEGVSRSRIGTRVGGPGWMVEQAYDRVAAVGTERLQAVLMALADVDWEMKSGRRDTALGLEALLLAL